MTVPDSSGSRTTMTRLVRGPGPRVLPIRLAPVAGEALDSWMEAYAARLGTSIGDLAEAFDLPRRPRTGRDRGQPLPIWTTVLHSHEANRIAVATGIDPQHLIGMTLQRYDGVGVSLDREARTVRTYRLWGRRRGSRYCPACLADSNGRWQLAWRLSWSFCCLRHGLLLVDGCPGCGQTPRAASQRSTGVPNPGHCSGPEPTIRHHAKIRTGICGFPLATADAVAVAATDSFMMAQRYVNDLLAGTDPMPIVHGITTPAAEVLADIKAVAAGMLTVIDEHDLTELPASILAQWRAANQTSTHRRRRTGFGPPPNAGSTAIAVSGAVQVITAPDISSAADRIGWVIDRALGRGLKATPTVMTSNWGPTSPNLQRILLRALDSRLRPLDRLRYATATPQPRFPRPSRQSTSAGSERAAKVPQQLWATWALRLMPPSGYEFSVFRAVMSVCLLLPGSRSTVDQLSRLLHQPLSHQTVNAVLVRLSRTGHREAILQTIALLAERLDNEPVPVDYQRRRELFWTSDLLTTEQWRSLCLQTGVYTGRGRYRNAQRLLFELLTGASPFQAPEPLTMRRGRDAGMYVTFCMTLPSNLSALLTQLAEERLADRGIAEPPSWEPPLDWVTPVDWPGPELDTVQPTALQRLLIDQGLSPGQAAVALGTSLEHVRLVLARHPIGWYEVGQGRYRRSGKRTPPASRQLSPDYVVYRYRDCGWSYRRIAQETGVSANAVAELCRLAGIQTRPPGRPSRFAVDKAWLNEQYYTRHRSFNNIAAELGMHPSTVRAIAHQFGMVPRPRGNRATSLYPDGRAIACPEWIRPAFQGHGGLQRVQRFIRVAQHSTISEAAKALRVRRVQLAHQIWWLEQDLGGVQLLIRATRTRPMRLTADGRKFVRQARRVLAELRAAG